MIKRVELPVRSVHNKMRLEDFLLDHFDSLSKMYLRDLVKDAQCEVNGRHENRGFKLRENDFVEIVIDWTRGTSMRPENIALDIVFEDDEIIVVNKPAGMLVHPSHRENSGTLLNALSFYLNKGGERERGRRAESEKRGSGKEEVRLGMPNIATPPSHSFSPFPLLTFSPSPYLPLC